MFDDHDSSAAEPLAELLGEANSVAEKVNNTAKTSVTATNAFNTTMIEVHPIIKKQLERVPVMDLAEQTDFIEVFEALLCECDARTLPAQLEVFDLSQRIIESWRLQHQQTWAIGSEMKPAAVALYRKSIDPAGRASLAFDEDARKMAEANRVGDEFCQDDLELQGFGPYPIQIEAAKRALPVLTALERLRASNERSKANGYKAIARIKASKE